MSKKQKRQQSETEPTPTKYLFEPDKTKEARYLTAPVYYRYYLVYQTKDIVGCQERTFPWPLNTWEHITHAADLIRRFNGWKSKVVITNFILL